MIVKTVKDRIIERIPKNFNIKLYTLSLLLALLILPGCNVLPVEEEELKPPVIQPKPATYQTLEIKKRSIAKKLVANGDISSVVEKSLFFEYRSGILKNLYVKKGDFIRKGDMVAELETGDLQDRIRGRQKALTEAESRYEQLKRSGQMDIKLAEARLVQLRSRYKTVSADTGSNSQEEKEDLLSRIKQQEIELKKLQSQYSAGKGKQEGYTLRAAAIDVEAEQVRLAQLMDELHKAQLVSPVSGQVIYVNDVKAGVEVAALLQLIKVADPAKLQVNYTSDDAYYFKPGMKVDVDIRGRHYTGNVVLAPDNLPADADESLQNSVRVNVENMPDYVSIGDLAIMTLTLEKADDTIVVPRLAVREEQGRTFVYVLENGVKTERDIRTGIDNGYETQVVKGLNVGDKVIIRN